MAQVKWFILASFICIHSISVNAQPGTIITNIQLVDGTGKPASRASVRIQGDKIVAINGKPFDDFAEVRKVFLEVIHG